jgi:hypothetical protein
MQRRHFFRSATLALAAAGSLPAVLAAGTTPPETTRDAWVALLEKVAEPVLAALADDRLKRSMPVEAKRGHEAARRVVTHLEALGRTLAGVAPWLAATGLSTAEEARRARMAALARRALARAVEPGAADQLDFSAAPQNLVDASFLALGLSRARAELWERLDRSTRERLVKALQATRRFKPGASNWLLFAATIEAFLASVGAEWMPAPIEIAFVSHEEWYKGDGMYGDGAPFHWDYYNSFVIQPMLLATLDLVAPVDARWEVRRETILKRALRFAAIQERHVAPDGTFPPIGRSLAYRCGAFHHLADMAVRRRLPAGLPPARVRDALGATIHRTLGAPGTFDEQGWLRIGLCGHQPSLGESYISTGSLYLCTFAFLPLGLPPADEFWSAPRQDRTAALAWSGVDLPADHAI